MSAHHHFKFSNLSQDKNQLKRLATYASVLVAFTLIASKAYAWYVTHSISLLSSLADSILDLVASIINMIAIHHAIKPADDEHRFGHGKIEALAALFQSIIIIFSAGFVLKEAAEHFLDPQPITRPFVGIIVTIVAVILTTFLVLFQRYVIHKTKSVSIVADSAHYKGDLYLNLGVLFSITCYIFFKWNYLDILFGAGIAIYIMFTTYKIIVSSFKILLDSELPPPDRQQILKIIRDHPKIKECCHLRTRSSGQEEFIQGHLIMNDHLSMEEAYNVIKSLEKKLAKLYPNAECLFQIKPHNIESKEK